MSQVQINRSNVAGFSPDSLLPGALFYNSADNKLYVGVLGGDPVLITSEPDEIAIQLDAAQATAATQTATITALKTAKRQTTVSTAAPQNTQPGDFWFDSRRKKLHVFSTEWVAMNSMP